MEQTREQVPEFIQKLQTMMRVTIYLFRIIQKPSIGEIRDNSLSFSTRLISGKPFSLSFLNMENLSPLSVK
jgi:hypothetical protein